MAKKLVVQRDIRRPRGGGAPYLKYLVFSAIGLIFLVVITPYLLRDKSRDSANKAPAPERGAITKELPKQVEQQPAPVTPSATPTAATTPQTATSPGAATTQGPAVSVNPPQTQPAPGPVPQGLSASQPASSPETAEAPAPAAPREAPARPPEGEQAQQRALFPAPQNAAAPTHPAEAAHRTQKQIFPKKGNRFECPVARSEKIHGRTVKQTGGRMNEKKAALSAKPSHSPMTPHLATTSGGAKGNQTYAVQVGSVYRTLGQAQRLRRRLAARGYNVSIRRAGDSGYLVVTSPITQSKAYTLREQMSAEGMRNTRVIGTCTPAAER